MDWNQRIVRLFIETSC